MGGEVVEVDRSGRGALVSTARGLSIAIRNLVRGHERGGDASTRDSRWADAWQHEDEPAPPHRRGAPVLLVRETDGEPLCTRCGACEQICPTRCIRVAPASASDANGDANEESSAVGAAVVSFFDLDLAACMFCGLCEDVCPDDAIGLSPHIPGAGAPGVSLVLDASELVALERGLPVRLERAPLREKQPSWRDTARESST